MPLRLHGGCQGEELQGALAVRLASLRWLLHSSVVVVGMVELVVVMVFLGRVGGGSRRALGSPAGGGGW